MTDVETPSGRSLETHAKEVFYAGQAAGQSLDVFIQDQTTPPFQYYLMEEKKTDITLTSPISSGDTVASVSAGHGFAVVTGTYMVVREGDFFSQKEVVGVAGDDITVKSPFGPDYSLDAEVLRGDINMNVDGSSTPVEYRCEISGQTPIDIQTAFIALQHSGEGDDSKFGDLAALTNGLLIEQISGGSLIPLGIYDENQDFREFGAEVDYTDKAGGGNYATNVTFDIKKKYGIVFRIDPRLGDCIRATVQDDLSSLLRLRIAIMGQATLGE